MLPGRRTADGALFVTQGPPPAGTPLVGGIAVRADGTIYVSQAFTPPFDPSDLFASGEQGAWYDPSDFSTMFQDSAGTTPVTAVGQPVGLILDKSQGLLIGPELVTNGTFNTDTAGWSIANTVTLTIDANRAKYQGISGNNDIVYQNVPTTAGKWYQVKWKAEAGTVNPRFFVGTSVANAALLPLQQTAGDFTGMFLATGSVAVVQFSSAYSLSPNTAFYDNISVKEIAGNHASQATAAARPVLTNSAQAKPYRNFDAVDDNMTTIFLSSLGSSCTVARSDPITGAVILTGQTIGTSYSASADDCTLIIVDRDLTSQETTDLTAWLNEKAGV